MNPTPPPPPATISIQSAPNAPATGDAALLHQQPAHYLRPGLLQLQALPPLSLYIHIPWCLKKCPYCDFNSHAAQPLESNSGSADTSASSVPKLFVFGIFFFSYFRSIAPQRCWEKKSLGLLLIK